MIARARGATSSVAPRFVSQTIARGHRVPMIVFLPSKLSDPTPCSIPASCHSWQPAYLVRRCPVRVVYRKLDSAIAVMKAAEVFGPGCQRRRSLTSQSEIIAGVAAKSE